MPTTPTSQLSPRERQVIELLLVGLTNKEIAGELDVSVHAVKFHLGSIFRKLGVHNRTQAALAYEPGGSRQVPPLQKGVR
jgi:DNA-binding CsgD family transcriptional regulator